MSEAKHSEGPWWVTDSGVRNPAGYICHTRPAQRYEGQDERYEKEKAERAADKVLIAAAPELLEALQQAIAALETCTPGDYSTGHVIHQSFDEDACSDAWIKATAAIAKATAAP